MIESLLTVNLLRLPDAVLARQRARSFAAALDLSRAAQAQLAVAVAEIARNALQHGSGGEVRFALDREGRALIVEISDDGPGIDDLAHQLEVGRSLRGAKLLVDEMTIETSPAGTVESSKPMYAQTIRVSASGKRSNPNGANGSRRAPTSPPCTTA